MDETLGRSLSASKTFMSGGFVAKDSDWNDWFAPAWQERVLDGPPTIPFMHVTDARDSVWQERHDVRAWDMEKRVEAAGQVIGSTGGLTLITSSLDATHFSSLFNETGVVMPTKQPGRYKFEPDYLCFLTFAHVALGWLDRNHDDVERVDFIVERKQDITRRFQHFYKDVASNFGELGLPEIGRIVGSLSEGDKTDLRLQAADFACWHLQRIASGLSGGRTPCEGNVHV